MASDPNGTPRTTISYVPGLSSTQNHRRAAELHRDTRLGYCVGHKLIGGATDRGYAFVFAGSDD